MVILLLYLCVWITDKEVSSGDTVIVFVCLDYR